MTRGSLDHVQHRQRRGQVFRDHSGRLRQHVSGARPVERHAAGTPESAILSAVIFNALIIVSLIPLALRGVRYRPVNASVLLRDNLLIYGVGGLIVPFVGIKVIDVLLVLLHFV